jgi:hypothetical protein
MARRHKQQDPLTDGESATAVAEPPPETNGTYTTPSLPEQPPPVENGTPPNRPVKAIRVAVGDGVRIEGSIWPREITVDGKLVTVYAATIRKTYRGEDGEYRHTGSYRGSEIPLVQYVLGACAQWILDQRREDDPPF